MTTRLGPIAELRIAVRSPLALTVGGLVGGAAPLLNYFTIHLGHLIDGDQVKWRSPLWVLVAGAFALSSKSVYRWGVQTFDDRMSAVGLVAMLETALLLSPHPAIGISSLVLLVAINVAVYGCGLALTDQRDKAAAAAADKAAQEPAPEPPAVPAPAAAAAAATPERAALPAPAALPEPPRSGDLYEGALVVLRSHSSISTEAFRKALRVRQPTAAELLDRLEQDGIVGKPDPADRGRRPVLLPGLAQDLS